MMERSATTIVFEHIHQTPVDLKAMATDLGLRVLYDGALPGSIAGKLERDTTASSGFRVVVNAADNAMRQRFTLAHEIAHYVLHRDLLPEGVVDSALYRSSLSDEYERQADRFAAQIILPADPLRREYARDKSLASLAGKFGVSDQALRIRLRELRLAP